MQLELKTNAVSVHSNLRGATHRNIGLFMIDTKYAILSNLPYVRPLHPGILQYQIMPQALHCTSLNESMMRISNFPTKQPESERPYFDRSARPPKSSTLKQLRTGLRDNIRETSVKFSFTLSQHMGKFYQAS